MVHRTWYGDLGQWAGWTPASNLLLFQTAEFIRFDSGLCYGSVVERWSGATFSPNKRDVHSKNQVCGFDQTIVKDNIRLEIHTQKPTCVTQVGGFSTLGDDGTAQRKEQSNLLMEASVQARRPAIRGKAQRLFAVFQAEARLCLINLQQCAK